MIARTGPGSVSNVSNIGREHKFVIKKAQLCAPEPGLPSVRPSYVE